MELDDRIPQSDAGQRVMRMLWRRKWWVFLVFDVFVLLAVYQASRVEDTWTATAQVRLPTTSGGVFDSGNVSDAALERELRTQIELVTSPQVDTLVDTDLEGVVGIVNSVQVNPLGETSILEITVEGTTPEVAADAANSYAAHYVEVRGQQAVAQFDARIDQIESSALEQRNAASALDAQIDALTIERADAQSTIAELDDLRNTGTAGLSAEQNEQLREANRQANLKDQGIQRLVAQQVYFVGQAQELETSAQQFRTERDFRAVNNAQVSSEASVPGIPDETSSRAILLAFAVLGLLAGIAAAFAREYLDESVHDAEELELDSERYPVLGSIANAEEGRRLGRRRDPTLVSVADRWSTVAESYRALRTNIEFAGLDRTVKTLLVTSASPGEGKSTTLANLAAVLAAAGSRVVVVCCDLRRPNIHRFFGKSNEVGFTSVLLGTHTIDQALQTVELPGGYTMQLMASGPLPPNPSEVLGSARAGEVLAQLRDRADYVLLDPPPVVPVTDAVVTSRWADAVVCVARMGVTRRRAFHQMLGTLDRTAVPILGIVLTGTGTQRTVRRDGYVYRSQRDQSAGLWSRVVGRDPGEQAVDADWDGVSRPPLPGSGDTAPVPTGKGGAEPGGGVRLEVPAPPRARGGGRPRRS